MILGRIITSDGWVLTHQSAFAGVDPRQTILMHNGAPAAVEQVIKDRATGLVFLKTNIKNVPSIRLGSMGSMHTGDKIAFGVSRGDWRLGELAKNYREFSLAPRDVLHTSEDLYRLATLANAPDKIAFGSPVVSRNNELVGVVATTRFGLAVVPIDYILTSKDEVFGSQKIDRPYLGVTYVSLPKDMLSGDAALNQNGALVTADLGVGAPGVAAKSPAALAGILAGDIITAVNDEEINQAHTLGELLMPYKKGDAIDIKLWRNGQEMTVKVTLDSILTSTVSPAKLVQ